jgi:hypothetical protein
MDLRTHCLTTCLNHFAGIWSVPGDI